MLFNSHAFLLVFLPLTLLVLRAAEHTLGRASAHAVLLLASLVFYGYSAPQHLPLLCASIAANHVFGRVVARAAGAAATSLLAAAVALNLLVLAAFKYGPQLSVALGLPPPGMAIADTALPIGLSFFTIQQIAYLVYCYRTRTSEEAPVQYGLFVALFPQLIAGPIVYYEMIRPQLRELSSSAATRLMRDQGATLLAIGLAKKVIVAEYAERVALPYLLQDVPMSWADAWGICLAIGIRSYFDASAYADMAVGLGLLLGLRFPVDFDAPLKATSLIEFWQRWRITLTAFLMSHVFRPIARGRTRVVSARIRLQLALMATFVLSGIWHGSGWTVALWGALHGAMMVANYAVRRRRRPRGGAAARWTGRLATNAFVIASLPLLYAGSEPALALRLYTAMFDFATGGWSPSIYSPFNVAALVAVTFVVWRFPTSQDLVGYRSPIPALAVAHEPVPAGYCWTRWRVAPVLFGAGSAIVLMMLDAPTAFVYFRF